MKPKTLVITGYGINSDRELKACFEKAGSEVSTFHINELISCPDLFKTFQIIGFPGGFSFGDHIASGKVFANKMRLKLKEEIRTFINAGKPVIGICNGFQVLVKMGILPDFQDFCQTVTLTRNKNGIFEDRWVRLKVRENHKNIWLKDIELLDLPVRHGEGRFVADENILKQIQNASLDVMYYADENGEKTSRYPENPNGSLSDIAALSNHGGTVLGLMPHPEAFMFYENHPMFAVKNRGIAGKAAQMLQPEDGAGMSLFYNAVNYVKNEL